MESKETLQCPTCSETRGSRRALNKHIRWHQRNAESSFSVRRVVLRDAPSEAAPVVPTGCMSISARDPRVESRMPQSPSVPTARRDPVKEHRRQIDVAVLCLKERHRQDRTTLSQRTDELVRWLRDKHPSVDAAACTGIVVAAKHFAGTHSPRRIAVKPVGDTRPVPPVPQVPQAREIRRRLFSVEQPESAAIGDRTAQDTVSSGSARKRRREPDDDANWKADIWRSYGAKEVQPPSPFGCQQSPSLAFASNGSSPPATTPVRLWSPSSNDEPWGPDSPDEALQEDGYPEIVPGWPVFLDTCGEPIGRNSSRRRAQVERWCTERTARVCRATAKRRHHLRTRRQSRERYRSIMVAMPKAQLTWETGVGRYRPLSPSAIHLPSPPPSVSALMRTRRLMLLQRSLPTGCRLRSRRSRTRRDAPEDQPSQQNTSKKNPRKRQHHELSPDIIIAAPQDDTL